MLQSKPNAFTSNHGEFKRLSDDDLGFDPAQSLALIDGQTEHSDTDEASSDGQKDCLESDEGSSDSTGLHGESKPLSDVDSASTGNHGESEPLSDVDLGLDSAQILAAIDGQKRHPESDEGSSGDVGMDESECDLESDEGSSDSDAGMDESELDYAAFRTITTFLHIIQKWPGLRHLNTKEDSTSASPNDRLVLKLCNSFAILSVIRHEVVAVGVGLRLESPRPEVELLLTEQGLKNFDILFNENPRARDRKKLRAVNGDALRQPKPPIALIQAYGGEPTEEQLKRHLQKLKVAM